MAFECNLASGNKAACQHHVSRQAVEHQQVLPEIFSPLQAGHENPQEFNKPEGALKLQMLERRSSAVPRSLTRKGPTFGGLKDIFRAKIGLEVVVSLHTGCQFTVNTCKDIGSTTWISHECGKGV